MSRSNLKQIQSSKKMKIQSEPKMAEKMVCAGTAACAADIVTFPLDVRPIKWDLEIRESIAIGNCPTGCQSPSTIIFFSDQTDGDVRCDDFERNGSAI